MKPELLSPVGNFECLVAAIEAGCDAVYLGGKHFGARNFAGNFSDEELLEAIKYAHIYGVKVYVTVNTIVYEAEVKAFISYIDFLHKNNVDAIIIQDIGMMDYLRQVYPNLEIHASTQMHIHNIEGVKLLEKLGIKRAVIARETDIETLKEIKKNTTLQLEVFVHGALCISYSGQCLMSSLIGGRSGNRGTCSQCCRMKYDFLHDNKKVNKENYLLSTKDLNTILNINELIDNNIDSIKIEGRMKRPEYVYLVTKMYRKAIDSYIETGKIDINDNDILELKKLFNRQFTKGFLFNEKNEDIINQYRPNHLGIELGTVIKYNNQYLSIELIDDLNIGDGIRILNETEDIGFNITKMFKDKKQIDTAKKGEIIDLYFEGNVSINDKIIKTTDKKQLEILNQLIKNKTRKISIEGSIVCKLNEPLVLKISDGNNSVKVTSKYTVEQFVKIPTSKEQIEEQLKKLGNTPYLFSKLDIINDDNIFINIKELNEIRREAIALLDKKRLYLITYKKEEYNTKVKEFKEEIGYTAYIYNIDQYNKQEKAIEIVTDDLDLYNSIVLDERVTLNIPRVITNHDDYNVRLLVGELGSINKYKDIVSDFSLNVVNSYSVAFLHNMGVKRVTLSLELNEAQIRKLIESYIERYNKKPNLELIVSSYPEVMISKFNLIKYYSLSNNNNYLKDKFKNRFKIEYKNNLMYIYHFKKIEFENHSSLFKMGINRLRIDYKE